MATKIIHKKSSTASSVPVSGDLEPGELAINLADKKIYSKTTGNVIIELGGGSAEVSLIHYRYVATAAQTVFSGADANANTLAMAASGQEIVTVNGVVLTRGQDYTITTTALTLLSAAAVSDEVNIHAFATFTLAGQGTAALKDAGTGAGEVLLLTAANALPALDGSDLTGINPPYLHVRDEKASGTDGGTATTGAWGIRDFNTIITNEVGASLSANVLTLLAGTYRIRANAPGHDVAGHRLRLYNITDAAVTLYGTSATTSTTYNGSNNSNLVGEFTIASTKTFRFEHRFGATKSNTGRGKGSGFGVNEIFGEAQLWKVG